jgi:septal ring factor EnvC (AmiA/AmiB activator)
VTQGGIHPSCPHGVCVCAIEGTHHSTVHRVCWLLSMFVHRLTTVHRVCWLVSMFVQRLTVPCHRNRHEERCQEVEQKEQELTQVRTENERVQQEHKKVERESTQIRAKVQDVEEQLRDSKHTVHTRTHAHAHARTRTRTRTRIFFKRIRRSLLPLVCLYFHKTARCSEGLQSRPNLPPTHTGGRDESPTA